MFLRKVVQKNMVGYSHTQKEVAGGCEECEHLAEKVQVYQVSISDLFYLIVSCHGASWLFLLWKKRSAAALPRTKE